MSRITLKNIKVVESRSKETACFTANLYLDGKMVGEVGNDGHGGPNFYDKGVYEQVKDAIKECDASVFMNDPDCHINTLVEHFETIQRVKRAMKKRTLYVLTDSGSVIQLFEQPEAVVNSLKTEEGMKKFLESEADYVKVLLDPEEAVHAMLDYQEKEKGVKMARVAKNTVEVSDNKPTSTKAEQKTTGGESKLTICKRLYAENPGAPRAEMIAKFMEIGCTKAGASTYYQTCKKG